MPSHSPNFDRAVVGRGDDEREGRVERDVVDTAIVAFEDAFDRRFQNFPGHHFSGSLYVGQRCPSPIQSDPWTQIPRDRLWGGTGRTYCEWPVRMAIQFPSFICLGLGRRRVVRRRLMRCRRYAVKCKVKYQYKIQAKDQMRRDLILFDGGTGTKNIKNLYS
jgi:hypothetical protein